MGEFFTIQRFARVSAPNLLITTFPESASANSGDLLISESFKELAAIVGVAGPWETMFREQELSDELVGRFGDRPIFLPGMSVSSESYPAFYRLRDNVDELPVGLIPFGCTWQHIHGYVEDAEQMHLSEATANLLTRIARSTGPIATRDHLAQRILSRNGIPAITVGDCAWYHIPSRGKPMRRPKAIRKVVVTTPHNNKLGAQSIELMEMLLALLPAAEVTLSLQSRPTPHLNPVIDWSAP